MGSGYAFKFELRIKFVGMEYKINYSERFRLSIVNKCEIFD